MTDPRICVLLVCIATSHGDVASAEVPNDRQRSDPKPLAIGETASSFTLRDISGRLINSRDVGGDQGTVVAFLGVECPLAERYTERLSQLNKQWANRGVRVVGVNSNSQDSFTEVAEFARKHQLNFPLLKDPGHRVADQFGAVRTPEVFLLDSDHVVRYWGRVDDQFAIGVQRDAPRRNDLAEAVKDLLEGLEVRIPTAPSFGCHIGRAPQGTPRGDVVYWQHAAPILNRHCVNCHHEQGIAPFPLTSYNDAASWSRMIEEVLRDGRMPPWFANPNHGSFANDRRLPLDERRRLLKWIANGCPEGFKPADFVEADAPQIKQPWRIGGPDLVLPISDKPFMVPATGSLDYVYFEVETNFGEDRFIRDAEVLPGNPRVVHHALVSIAEPNSLGRGIGNLGVLINYAPGMQPTRLGAGQGIRLPAGARLLVQMHYTPNGTPQEDVTQIGLRFADLVGGASSSEPPGVEQEVFGAAIANAAIAIPPEVSRHAETATWTVTEDLSLLSLSPHLHLRGRSFRYVAVYPDGVEEILLDVPRYDYNWQLRYRLKIPKRIPAGSKIVCQATFDNSWSNLSNPDPMRWVRWGERTRDEMLIGFFTYAKAGRAEGLSEGEAGALRLEESLP